MAHGSPIPPEVHASVRPATFPVHDGRLVVYSAFGASVSAMPLPWIPDLLMRHIRGALVQDIAVRHGVTLTREARSVFADPLRRRPVMQAARFLGARLVARTLTRLAPVNLIWPASGALRTYVLGHLFDRYLEARGAGGGVEMAADEARRVLGAVDRALSRVLSVSARPLVEPPALGDERDSVTALVDSVLSFAAGIPERLSQRLDSAFDEAIASGCR